MDAHAIGVNEWIDKKSTGACPSRLDMVNACNDRIIIGPVKSCARSAAQRIMARIAEEPPHHLTGA